MTRIESCGVGSWDFADERVRERCSENETKGAKGNRERVGQDERPSASCRAFCPSIPLDVMFPPISDDKKQGPIVLSRLHCTVSYASSRRLSWCRKGISGGQNDRGIPEVASQKRAIQNESR